MGEVFVVLGGRDFLQRAASRTVGKREGGTTRGSRPAGYAPVKRVTHWE